MSDATDLETQLRVEIEAMLRHAFSSGLEVPAQVMDGMEVAQRDGGAPLAALGGLHTQLAKLVSPAMPGTLHLLRTDAARDSLYAVLGPLKNVRRLMIAALLCMVAFVLISLSPLIDGSAMASDIYTMDGINLLTTMAFLLAAAGLGSTFQALFTAQAYVSNATYDPRYDASYWIRIGLGLVAGLLLSVLVPINSGNAPTIAKPVLALLGGFSAGLVYRILQRLVDTVESLFQGDRNALLRREGELNRTGTQHAIVEARIDLATQLMSLRDELAKGASAQQLSESLSVVLDGLLQKQGPAGVRG
jgi:hypothetical protein